MSNSSCNKKKTEPKKEKILLCTVNDGFHCNDEWANLFRIAKIGEETTYQVFVYSREENIFLIWKKKRNEKEEKIKGLKGFKFILKTKQ